MVFPPARGKAPAIALVLLGAVRAQTVPARQWISTVPFCNISATAVSSDGRIFLVGIGDSHFLVTSNAFQPVIANASFPTVQYPPGTSGVPGLNLAGTQVLLNSTPIPLISVQEARVYAWVPFTLSTSSYWTVVVESNGVNSNPGQVPGVSANPALFTALGNGTGQALAFNGDGSQNSPSNPARRGSLIKLIATGLGPAAGAGDLSELSVTLETLSAAVSTVGAASGYPRGYLEVDAIVPNGVPAADFIPVKIAVSGISSQDGVTLSVR